jgi:hypothetical protein
MGTAWRSEQKPTLRPELGLAPLPQAASLAALAGPGA